MLCFELRDSSGQILGGDCAFQSEFSSSDLNVQFRIFNSGEHELSVFEEGRDEIVPYRLKVDCQGTCSTINISTEVDVQPGDIGFSAVEGQQSDLIQNAFVLSDIAGLHFAASATTESGGDWLRVTTSGSVPASIPLRARVSDLAAGTYVARVEFSSPAGQFETVRLPVILVVEQRAVSETSSSTETVSFTARDGQAARLSEAVSVSNRSSEKLSLELAIATTSGDPWLSALLNANNIAPGGDVDLSLSVDPRKLSRTQLGVEGAAVLKLGSLRESSKSLTTKENRREETVSHS